MSASSPTDTGGISRGDSFLGRSGSNVCLRPPLVMDAQIPPKGILKSGEKSDLAESGRARRKTRMTTGRRVRFASDEGRQPGSPMSGDVFDQDGELAPAALSLPGDAEEFQMIMNMAVDAEAQQRESPEESTDDATRLDAAVEAVTQDFSVNPILLTFRDPRSESKYVQFVIENKSFLAGKLYTLMSGVVSFVLLIPYLNFDLTPEKVASFYVIFLFSCIAIAWLILGLFFLDATLPIREYLFFFTVATHWPAFASTTIMVKEDKAYRYAYTSGCFVFCCFIAQPRFVGMFFFLTLTPIATLFATTFADSDYWDNNNKFEIIYWGIPLFPLYMLRIFETRSREAFVENERGKATMEVLNQRSTMTKKLLARFFPLTATMRLLKTHGQEQYAVYPGTALFFSTVEGFTEWAAVTSAEMVVSHVAQMFITMEKLAKRYGVEKVSTIGDTYFGAVFPFTARTSKGGNPSPDDEVNRSTASDTPKDAGLDSTQQRHLPRIKHLHNHSNDNTPPAGTVAIEMEPIEERDDVRASPPDSPASRMDQPGSVGMIPLPLHRTNSQISSKSQSTSSGSSEQRNMAERAHRILRFATAVRHHKDVMPIRIGCHIGAVIGGFVGIQPPKFDLFGAAIQRLHNLESKSKKRRIHGSQEIIDAACDFGRPSDDFEASDVSGQIFSSWRANRDGGPNSATELNSGKKLKEKEKQDASAEADEDYVEERALVLCAYLAKFGEGQRDKAMRGFETREALLKKSLARAKTAPREIDLGDDEVLDNIDRVSDAASDPDGEPHERKPLLLDDDDVLRIENPGDEKELYTFSMLRMEFTDPKVESQYINRLITSQLSREVFITFAIMALFLVCGHIGTACTHTPADRMLPMIIIMILVFHLGYLHYVGTSHNYAMPIVQFTYSVISWLAAMMYQPGCGYVDEIHAGGNMVALYFFLIVASPSFSLEIRMPIRLLFLVINAGQMAAATGIRRLVYGDDVLVWEALPPAFVLAFTFMSLFSDFTMRCGFQATMRRRALQNNRSEYAEQTAEALEMMIPSFVIDRLLRAAKRGHVVDMSDLASQQSGASAATGLSALSALSGGSAASTLSAQGRLITGDVAQAMLMRRSETVWPYPRAVVMFVSFEPPVMAYDTISDTVMRIEAVARGRSIQKVKTIGTTVVLVAGIDKSLQFDDAVVNVVDAALEIQRRVFPVHLTEGWKHRIGIHCGPIYGAVIGSQSLAFDVYGDTVNTASVMESTAPANSIRCTAAIRQALPLDEAELDFAVDSIPIPIQLKGKGALQVYHVQERERHRVGPVASTQPQNSQVADHESSSSDPSDPSAYAESIRSSIRSAAMLPSAAAAGGAFGGHSESGELDNVSDSPDSQRPSPPRQRKDRPSSSIPTAGTSGNTDAMRCEDIDDNEVASVAPTNKSGAASSASERATKGAETGTNTDTDTENTDPLDKMKRKIFDDDIAGFSDEDD
jgi:class 3 adenylate cyclase